MHRTIRADIAFTMSTGHTRVAFMVAVAKVPGLQVSDDFTVSMDGSPVEVTEAPAPHHGRIHLLDVDAGADAPGKVEVAYRAEVTGGSRAGAEQAEEPSATELLTYVRPSRYAESDRLLPTARQEFNGLQGPELLDAVAAFVHERLSYVRGSSHFTDGAVDTLLARRGVCRDYAHLVVALLRGLDVPARCAAVYAPGLSPMDFHAVAEAWVEGHWQVVDATRLAPRQSLVRIATGRDAADTAFMSSYGAGVRLGPQSVMATLEGELPIDDHAAAVRLP
ncbi:transglutaminase-like domain-containing protein [Pseudactinotalea sp. Z1732]|uniref:transglutaminase-like domain-containing protein n=1 Tax=Micrococcales TaxID=85006 RepID=UPI003C7BD9E6